MGSNKLTIASFATALCATLCAVALSLPAAAHAAACPNEALREGQGATSLPGCMALEMVSPPEKQSLPAFLPWFSLDGERLAYRSMAALGETPGLQFFAGDVYLGLRGASAWSTEPTSPPASAAIATGTGSQGGPFALRGDLGCWLSLGSTWSQSQVSSGHVYRGCLDGSFDPFSSLLTANDNSGNAALQFVIPNVPAHGISADLSRAVIRTSRASAFFLEGDPRNPGKGEASSEVGGDFNSYLVSNVEGVPSLELLARDDIDGEIYGGRCGTHLGGGANGLLITQGAISEDGETIFFTTRPAQEFEEGADPEDAPACSEANPLRIMERSGEPGAAEVSEIAPTSPAGDDLFQGASADATKVYFTTARQIPGTGDLDTGAQCSAIPGNSAGCDLYLYDSTKEGSQITLVSSGDGAEVLSSITAVSGDGSRAYFVAEGVLTADANPKGATAIEGQPNLYAYEAGTGTTSFIGTLDPEDDQGALWGTEGSFTGDAYAVPLYGPGPGGDGHILAFASAAPLTGEDDDADGGERDVFRYDAAEDTLIRISTAAAGGEDDGPFGASVNPNPPSIAGSNLPNLDQRGRFASEDGETIAFNTAAPLISGDADTEDDPYVWKEGELGTLDAVVDAGDQPTVSPDGGEVALATSTQLLPQDRDSVKDVYVAKANGGYPLPVPPPDPCNPLALGSCRPLAAPLGAVAVPSATIAGAGNVKEAKKCKKGFKKNKKGRCVKKKSRKAKKHRKGKAKQKGKR